LPAPESSERPGNSSGAAEIAIKTSSHKSLTTFLKAAEKASILTLKAPQKHSQQPELLVTSVNGSHPSILGHHRHVAVKDIDKAAKRALMAKEKESQEEPLAVREFWKPHQASLNLFDEMGVESVSVLIDFANSSMCSLVQQPFTHWPRSRN
jgi:translation initiation factor 2D